MPRYLANVSTAKFIAVVAAHFEETAGTDASWLWWDVQILPDLKCEMAQYQEVMALNAAVAAESNHIEWEC